jgi:hypothetical protein
VVGTGWWHGEAAETPSEPRVAGGARGGRAKDKAGEEGGRRHQRWGKRGGGRKRSGASGEQEFSWPRKFGPAESDFC